MKRTIDCTHMLKVDIRLKNSPLQGSTQTYVQSFATGETIDGVVSILSQDDLIFENLHISFIGEQSTCIASAKPNKATHEFLHLIQHLPDATLPSPRVFRGRTKYEIPFSFLVPDYLPARACPHSSHPLVKAAHLHPPPSIGDATIAGFGGRLRDDLAPETACKVVYTIIFKLERPSITTRAQETIMDKRLKVRIKPHVGEIPLPDLDLGAIADEYRLASRGDIGPHNKGAGKGKLAVTLEQPECFWHPLGDTVRLISKAVRLFFVYTPSSSSGDSQGNIITLPELKSLRAQITATTLYTTKFDGPHPPQKQRDFFGRPINFRDADITLEFPSLPQLRWERMDAQAAGPNQSPNPETGPGPGPPGSSETEISYIATLLVPVTLTKEKSFVPTFHSCLISRIYSLSFQLEVKGASSSFRLKAPMQIAAERDPSALPSYNASLGVIETEP